MQYRRKALEESFFAKRNQQLLEKLRTEQDRKQQRDSLAQLTGTQDPAVLDRILELGIRPETWTAMTYIPMVAVAWADGVLDTRERKAILEAADRQGIQPGTPGYELLDGWLAADPGPSSLETWKLYMRSLLDSLDADGREHLRQHVLDLAHDVASAAGGVLGMAAISNREKRVLDELRAVFE